MTDRGPDLDFRPIQSRILELEAEVEQAGIAARAWRLSTRRMRKRAKAAEAKLAEAEKERNGWKATAESIDAKWATTLTEVEKERDAISVQCGEERKARKAAEKINTDEVIAKRTNLLARIESVRRSGTTGSVKSVRRGTLLRATRTS